MQHNYVDMRLAACFFAFQVSESLTACHGSNYNKREGMKVTSVNTCLPIFKLDPQPRMIWNIKRLITFSA